MVATKVGSPRHPTEAELLERALAGQPLAVENVFNQLGTTNHWLKQLMAEAIQDCAEPLLWQRLLGSLALHRWGETADIQRRAEREASGHIDTAIVQLFVSEEETPAAPVRLATLYAGLNDANSCLRSTAATLLGFRGDARGIELIVDTVRAGNRECRLRAMAALGRLRDERGGWVLAEALADDDDVLHSEAARALAELEDKVLPAVLDLLKSPKPHVRWHAVHILGKSRDLQATTGLAEALADGDYSVRWAAAEALAGIGLLAIPKILERLSRHAPVNDVYQVAHHTLRQISQTRPHDIQPRLQPLLKALQDPGAPVLAPMEAYRLLQQWEVNNER